MARLILQTYGVMIIGDVIVELIMTRTGLISYPTTIQSLTLFAGTDHQFPISETVSWAGTYTALACLHFFRDDHGHTLPERGFDALKIGTGRLKTFARFLAIMGACQLAMLFTYNVPYSYWGMHAVMAQPFVEREWRTAGVCGPHTAFNCPDGHSPIATKDSPTNRTADESHP